MKMMWKISVCIILISLLTTTILSGYMILKELSARQKEKDEFDEIAELVELDDSNLESGSHKKSRVKKKAVSKRNISSLIKKNKDCIGWIYIPGTTVNYPVMHTPKNPQKYLRRNFYGKYSMSGVPFLDYRCNLKSDNLIIYGHNMLNNTMFSDLKKYLDYDYCFKNPIIQFETADECCNFEIFAVIVTDKTDAWYTFIETQSEENFNNAVQQIIKKSNKCWLSPVYGDRLLTLSTCYGSQKVVAFSYSKGG